MIENINYKRCVCDICGKEEKIIQPLMFPKDWEEINIGKKTYDVCIDCFVKVDMTIEDLRDKALN